MTTDPGAGGMKASSLSKPIGNNYGLSFNNTTFFAVAEDFTVPTGQTWNVDTIVVYGYQTGSSTSSPINYLTMQVCKGSVTGASVFGDTTTNRLSVANFSGIYRVDTSASSGGVGSSQRPIIELKVKVTPTLSLTAGTYWLIYSARGNSSLTGPWANPKVLPNRVNPTAQNGMQRVLGVWRPAKDSISPTVMQNLGFPLKILGPKKLGVTGAAAMEADLHCLPNPATERSRISFNLAAPAQLSLRVFSATGQLVKTLAQDRLGAGRHEYGLEGAALPPGNYYCELQTEEGRQTSSFQVVR